MYIITDSVIRAGGSKFTPLRPIFLSKYFSLCVILNPRIISIIMDLLNKKCVPCEGGTKPLTGERIAEYLQVLTGWQVKEEKYLIKEYQCKDFTEALAFVNAIGEIAEAEGHHPDINLHSWNKVALTLSTHAIGGLSINDFILAAKIDAMKKERFAEIK